MSQTANKPVEVGVVLQGGGALGAYECGALNALLEAQISENRSLLA